MEKTAKDKAILVAFVARFIEKKAGDYAEDKDYVGNPIYYDKKFARGGDWDPKSTTSSRDISENNKERIKALTGANTSSIIPSTYGVEDMKRAKKILEARKKRGYDLFDVIGNYFNIENRKSKKYEPHSNFP